MTGERTYIDFLEDIQDAIEKVAEFIAGMTYEQFAEDSKTAFAVTRALEVLGEAAKQVPETVRIQYPEIPWREMGSMRDKLIHHYFGVNLKVVWRTATEDLCDLAPRIEKVLNEVEELEDGLP